MDPKLIEVTLKTLDAKVDRVLYALEGNGKPGLLIEVDRLKEAEKRRSKLVWVILAACGTSVLAAIKTFIGFKV